MVQNLVKIENRCHQYIAQKILESENRGKKSRHNWRVRFHRVRAFFTPKRYNQYTQLPTKLASKQKSVSEQSLITE